jgi:peroxiredoxin
MMAISTGDKLPDVTLVAMGESGPVQVSLAERLKGRKVVIYGMPGAFTGTCSGVHIPSVVRTAEAMRAKGVDEIMVVTVNDPFVIQAWGDATGANAAGVSMLGDASGDLAAATGMAFTAPAIGLYNRSSRFACVVEDGVVTVTGVDAAGQCDLSTGEAILEKL